MVMAYNALPPQNKIWVRTMTVWKKPLNQQHKAIANLYKMIASTTIAWKIWESSVDVPRKVGC